MLTPRERAAGAYAAALAQGRGRIQGIDDTDMVETTDARLANVRAAQRTISAARGAERHFIREPDDARLTQMLARIDDLAETLEKRPRPVRITRWLATIWFERGDCCPSPANCSCSRYPLLSDKRSTHRVCAPRLLQPRYAFF